MTLNTSVGQIGFFCIHPGCQRSQSFVRFRSLQEHNVTEHTGDPSFVNLVNNKCTDDLQLECLFHYKERPSAAGRSNTHVQCAAATRAELNALQTSQIRKRTTDCTDQKKVFSLLTSVL